MVHFSRFPFVLVSVGLAVVYLTRVRQGLQLVSYLVTNCCSLPEADAAVGGGSLVEDELSLPLLESR